MRKLAIALMLLWCGLSLATTTYPTVTSPSTPGAGSCPSSYKGIVMTANPLGFYACLDLDSNGSYFWEELTPVYSLPIYAGTNCATFGTPDTGTTCWDTDDKYLMVYNGSTWVNAIMYSGLLKTDDKLILSADANQDRWGLPGVDVTGDGVPEYWFSYRTTQCNPDDSVVIDDYGKIACISKWQASYDYLGHSWSQSDIAAVKFDRDSGRVLFNPTLDNTPEAAIDSQGRYSQLVDPLIVKCGDIAVDYDATAASVITHLDKTSADDSELAGVVAGMVCSWSVETDTPFSDDAILVAVRPVADGLTFIRYSLSTDNPDSTVVHFCCREKE